MKDDPYFINPIFKARSMKNPDTRNGENYYLPIHWKAPFLDGCLNCKGCPSRFDNRVLDKDDIKKGTYYRCEEFEYPGAD